MGELGLDTLVMVLAFCSAGFVDAVVGGGGLITVPSLFSVFPDEPPPLLLGTNKGAAMCGTSLAAWQYARRIRIDMGLLAPALALALMGSALGAFLVSIVPPDGLRKMLPVLMLGVLLYTLRRKNFGTHPQHIDISRAAQRLRGAVIGLSVGIYDGFFGPGTGSFFIFLLVRWLGYDFLQASASAKLLNVATNLSAMAVFAAGGHVHWGYVAIMGLANIVGSWMGTYIAIRKGSGFVRHIFICVVCALLLKTAYAAWG